MTEDDVRVVAKLTFDQHPELHTVESAVVLLRHTIWRLNKIGVAGRQRNPSGAISEDKLTVVLSDGKVHAYDLYGLQTPLSFSFSEVFPADMVEDAGLPDDGENGHPLPPTNIPYDEAKAVEFGLACNDVYRESGARIDPGMISVMSQRAAWDYYVNGLSWAESKRKHINELRKEYGLGPL